MIYLYIGGEDLNLYCYKLKNSDNEITDVYHIVAKNDDVAHSRLRRTIEKAAAHGLGKEYSSFSFNKVDYIDGFRVKLCDENPIS